MPKFLDDNGLETLCELIKNNTPKIATGSYTGTGTYPVSITFPFVPKTVFIVRNKEYGFFVRPDIEQIAEQSTTFTGIRLRTGMDSLWSAESNGLPATMNGTTLSFSTDRDITSGFYGFNVTGYSYYYVAIG